MSRNQSEIGALLPSHPQQRSDFPFLAGRRGPGVSSERGRSQERRLVKNRRRSQLVDAT